MAAFFRQGLVSCFTYERIAPLYKNIARHFRCADKQEMTMTKIFGLALAAIVLLGSVAPGTAQVRNNGQSVQDITGGW
jgi:hypothetical protein